jgi:hypothetical protein
MTPEPPQGSATEGVRSLEVRWIFPGQLETAVAEWFGRFPAERQEREDTYLLDTWLRGLSVKVRGGAALEVKEYRGSPGLLDLAGRACGRMEFWRKSSFPVDPPLGDGVTWPAGYRYARGGGSAGSHWRAGRPRPNPRDVAESRGAQRNSPRSAPPATTGGPWDSRRPAPKTSSAARSRPRHSSYSPWPCPAARNPARLYPAPTQSGCASCGWPRLGRRLKTAPRSSISRQQSTSWWSRSRSPGLHRPASAVAAPRR